MDHDKIESTCYCLVPSHVRTNHCDTSLSLSVVTTQPRYLSCRQLTFLQIQGKQPNLTNHQLQLMNDIWWETKYHFSNNLISCCVEASFTMVVNIWESEYSAACERTCEHQVWLCELTDFSCFCVIRDVSTGSACFSWSTIHTRHLEGWYYN